MKNLILALALTVSLGAGIYYFKFSKVTNYKEEPHSHSHDGGDPHSHDHEESHPH